jgi:hypothetical protein
LLVSEGSAECPRRRAHICAALGHAEYQCVDRVGLAANLILEAMMSRVLIRPRTDADLQDCELLGRVVHQVDGYPPYLPDGNIGRFIRSPSALAAWVAHRTGQLAGHIALNDTSSAPVLTLAI